jgi:hypothetical protein
VPVSGSLHDQERLFIFTVVKNPDKQNKPVNKSPGSDSIKTKMKEVC